MFHYEMFMKKIRVLPYTKWAAPSFWAIKMKSLAVLLIALMIIGFGEELLLLSDLGSAPWAVLSQGIALKGGFSVGWASFLISGVVMLMWLPLKLKIGFGTVLNIIVIAFCFGLTTYFILPPESLFFRSLFAVGEFYCLESAQRFI